MSELVARARGLTARIAEERAAMQELSVDDAERLARTRVAHDLATLARWADRDELAAIELDEDRRSLRAIVRGLAAGMPAERRRLATVPTSRLRERVLDRLAEATSTAEIHEQLVAIDHPLGGAFAGDATTIDLFATEAALADHYHRVARDLATDRATRAYVEQIIEAEQARTPEDALLDQQLATQRRLRRTEPHGLAAVIYAVLTRRAAARHLRRAAWRHALGGVP